MRKANNPQQVQLILNQLNNASAKLNTKPLNRNGNRVVNVGDAQQPNDVVTLSQVQRLIQSGIQQMVPRAVQTQNHYTMLWTNGGASLAGDLLEGYCVVSDNRVGIPLYAWIAAQGTALLTGPLIINIQLNGTNILTSNLILPQGVKGPVQSSNFIGNPIFGIGSTLVPIIIKAGGQVAISIGLVCQVNGLLSLSQTNKS